MAWTDDFSGALDARWSGPSPSGGAVAIPMSSGGGFMYSTATTDLTDSVLEFDLSVRPDTVGNTGYIYFALYIDAQNNFSITISETTITARHNIAGAGLTLLATASVTAQNIRFREEDGVLYYEYSWNGDNWIQFHSEATPIAVTALNQEWGSYKDGGETTVTDPAITYAEYQPASTPVNDNFADRIVISGTYGSTAGNNTGATLEPDEASVLSFGTDYGSSVWYEWECPEDGFYVMRAEFPNPLFDAIITLVSGTGYGDFVVETQVDNFYGDQIGITLDEGVTYYVNIAGYIGNSPNDEGAFNLMWRKENLNPTTLAFDAATESIKSTTADPYQFTHTPVGTPRAVVVTMVQNASTVNYVDGVTYGGVAMKRIGLSDQVNVQVSEFGAVQAWFLGDGIPTGAQTVSVDMNATTAITAQFVAMTFTADDDTLAIGSTSTSSGTMTNVTRTPAKNLNHGVTIVAGFSGQDAPASMTDAANSTRVHDHDFGTRSAAVWRESTGSLLDYTIGGTQTSDDGAVLGFAVVTKRPAAALPASALFDEFDGTVFGTDYLTSTTDGTVAQSGNAQLNINASASGYAEIGKFFRYDLRSGSICWKADASGLANSTDLSWTVKLYDAPNHRSMVTIEQAGGVKTVYISQYEHGNRTGKFFSEAYSTTAHKWLRFRESGGTVYVEKSADGIDWTTMQSRAYTIPFDSVSFYSQLETFGTNAASATWDNLNSPPLGVVDMPVGFGASVAGRQTYFGALDAPFTFGVATAGTVTERVEGAVDLPLTVTIGTAGTVNPREEGATDLPITVGIGTSAKTHRHGSVTLPITVGIQSSGGGRIEGDASFDIVFNAAVAGTVHPRHEGSVTDPITFGADTAGTVHPRHEGAVSTDIIFGVATAGTVHPQHEAAVDMPITFGSSAAAQVLRRASVSFPIGLIFSAYIDPEYPILGALPSGSLELTAAAAGTQTLAPLAAGSLELVVAPEHSDLLMEALANGSLSLTVLPEQGA